MTPSIKPLLDPASVAIVGASTDKTRIGGRVLDYMIRGNFRGRIIPVNPNRTEVQGLPAAPSILAMDAPVDTAILAVPAPATAQAVRDCAAKGVKACVIYSAGFAETGADGAVAEAELKAISRETGVRLLGPNCLGVFNSFSGFYGCFTSAFDRVFPTEGPLSIISQSGAVGSHLFWIARDRGLGLRYWVSTGNECDVDVAECLSFVADDPHTKVAAVYLEGARNGRALMAAMRKMAALGKSVIALKVGRSEVGSIAAASHTASLVGGDEVYETVFRECGVYRARSAEELVDVAELAVQGRMPKGPRLGIVTISGGGGIMVADEADAVGLEMPEMPADAQADLKAALPFSSPRNPVDVTAQAFNDLELFGRYLNRIVDSAAYDAVIAFFTTVAGSPAMAPKLLDALKSVRARHLDFPIIMSIVVNPDLVAQYVAEGFGVIADPNRAVRALAGLVALAKGPQPAGDAVAPEPLPPGPYGEARSKAVLAAAGVPVATETLATSIDEAVAAWRMAGRPVAMKISAAAIAHKSEVGGVRLNVGSEQEVRAAFVALMDIGHRHAGGGPVDGVLVSPMITGHVEAIVGVKRDPVFGPVVMFGLGGIFVEVMKDVAFRLAPFGEAQAHAMIREIKGFPLLDGARGRPKADVSALAKALVAVSRFAARCGDTLESLDINPLAVMPEGEGVFALDALIVPRNGSD
ncbi:MAG: acetate--CoA ligase family protein [Hyphomicrobiales bacterium]